MKNTNLKVYHHNKEKIKKNKKLSDTQKQNEFFNNWINYIFSYVTAEGKTFIPQNNK